MRLERLRHIREQAGYSQQDLADESGVSQHTISELELGRRRPQGRTLRKLAQALGVEVVDLREDTASPKAESRSSLEPTLLNGLEEERHATISDVLGSWRGEHEEAIARWSRAIERGFSSIDAAAAFCAEVIAEGAVGQHIIKEYLLPQAEALLPQAEAARERRDLLETHDHLEEAMGVAISLVEGMADIESDVDAAAKAIRRYLDTPLARSVDETRAERHDRIDLKMYLGRERRRRRKAGTRGSTEPAEGKRKRPTA